MKMHSNSNYENAIFCTKKPIHVLTTIINLMSELTIKPHKCKCVCHQLMSHISSHTVTADQSQTKFSFEKTSNLYVINIGCLIALAYNPKNHCFLTETN